MMQVKSRVLCVQSGAETLPQSANTRYTFSRQACAGTWCAEEVCSRYEYVVRYLLYPLQRCLQVFQFPNVQGSAGNVENLLPATAKSYMTGVTIITATGSQLCSHYFTFYIYNTNHLLAQQLSHLHLRLQNYRHACKDVIKMHQEKKEKRDKCYTNRISWQVS